MRLKGIFFSIFSLLLIASCDYIDNPIQGGGSGPNPGDTIVMRSILIDDFTGHRCVNCPEAAHAIEQLKQNAQFKDRVIAVGIHTGFFATPLGSFYSADYRTTEGDNLNSIFGPSSFPIGMVNRIDYPNSHLKNYTDWANYAANFLDSTAVFDIQPTINYNASSRSLQVDAKVDVLRNQNGLYNIVVFITEDNLVSPQLTHTGNDTNYVHDHVLRGSTNTEIGEAINSSALTLGDVVNYSSATITLDNAWKADDCHVVIYIYDTATHTIMQVVESKII